MNRRDTLKSCLDCLAQTYGGEYLDSDPVGIVHEYTNRTDIEVAGFVAAILAYGGAGQIRQSVRNAMERLDNDPASFVRGATKPELTRRFRGFKHRWTGGEDMAFVLGEIGGILAEYGDIGSFVETLYSPSDSTVENTLALFSKKLTGNFRPASATANTRKGIAYLVPSPVNGSACKRMAMYFRWMVRGPDAVDFGLWQFISPSRLIIPVDRHIARMGALLGLTARNSPDWKMAIEISESLKALNPEDPLRYDFALVRPGILRECSGSSKGDCPSCALKDVCREAE